MQRLALQKKLLAVFEQREKQRKACPIGLIVHLLSYPRKGKSATMGSYCRLKPSLRFSRN